MWMCCIVFQMTFVNLGKWLNCVKQSYWIVIYTVIITDFSYYLIHICNKDILLTGVFLANLPLTLDGPFFLNQNSPLVSQHSFPVTPQLYGRGIEWCLATSYVSQSAETLPVQYADWPLLWTGPHPVGLVERAGRGLLVPFSSSYPNYAMRHLGSIGTHILVSVLTRSWPIVFFPL